MYQQNKIERKIEHKIEHKIQKQLRSSRIIEIEHNQNNNGSLF